MYSLQQKTKHAVCLLVLSLLLGSCEPSSSKTWQLEVFDPTSHQTRQITEKDLAQKLLVINYWAEWCKPCIAEIPELNRFVFTHQDKIIMLGVNFDNKQDTALQEAMHKVSINFPVTMENPANILTLPEITGLPTTLILDEHGVLKKQLLGPQTFDSLEAAISEPQSL